MNGKLERFGLREAARRVTRQRPDDIDDAVLCLIVKLRGRTAELHGREQFDLDAAFRFFLDLLGPGRDEVARHRRLRRQELMNAERDFLRRRGAGAKPMTVLRQAAKQDWLCETAFDFLPNEFRLIL
jgi:hypothetical protein